jgi:hypothetical protein
LTLNTAKILFNFEILTPVLGDVLWETVKIEVSQHGPTKAFNVNGHAKVVLTQSKTPPPMTDMEPMSLPTIIKGDSVPVPEHINIPFNNADELDAIRNESLFAHLFGVITYEDVFEKSHRTPFRFMWKIDGFYADKTVSDSWMDTSCWVPWGDPEDNRAT